MDKTGITTRSNPPQYIPYLMKPIHILHIEDEAADLLLLNKLLKISDHTFHCTAITNCKSALQYLSEVEPQKFPVVILLDLMFPSGMGGFDFLEAYAARFYMHHHRTKIIVLTSSALKQDRKSSLEHEFVTEYWTKPVSLMQINKIARYYMHQQIRADE